MAKDEIKKLLENSEKNISQAHDDFVKSVKDDLQQFKKKTLEKI